MRNYIIRNNSTDQALEEIMNKIGQGVQNGNKLVAVFFDRVSLLLNEYFYKTEQNCYMELNIHAMEINMKTKYMLLNLYVKIDAWSDRDKIKR